MAMNSGGLRPGNKAPASGQYTQIDPRGGRGREVEVMEGEPLPPTMMKRATYEITGIFYKRRHTP